MADPLFTPALVGAAVSSFFTEVINAAKSAYRHKKKCKLLLESVDKLQPHVDAACTNSADWEKAQTDALAEIKGILDNARSFAEKDVAESKFQRQKRAMAFWRWGKLPAELLDIIFRIEEAMLNVLFCAADENARRKKELLTFVPQQNQSARIVGVDIPFNRLKASMLTSHAKDTLSHLGLHGRGGAGKTLLAQMLHNDKDVIEAYGAHSIVWITVGLDARVADLYKTMATFLQDGGFKKHYGHRSLQDQRTYLWNAFTKQKVFLILDDVWQERCEENHAMMYWLNIATAPGSTTLITTRNFEVLSKVYAESEIVLSLSEEDSWTLFCSHAFHDGTVPATVPEQLAQDVCRECQGLPLALKVVGSAMVDKVEAGEWNSALHDLKHSKPILGSTVDNELFGQLRWSYDKLEGDVLKTCFLYFAAFPEDYKIPTTELFNMWISEGLVDGEDEAQAHLKVLENRSLIHLNRGERGERSAQVHDILRDLALLVIDTAKPGECGYDCYFQSGKVLRTFPSEKSLKTITRLSFNNTTILYDLYNLQAPHLQVCLLSGVVWPDAQIQKCYSNAAMISLKYLDLSRNHFNTLELALLLKSMGGVKNLVHLDLSKCELLEQLPESMGELKCLAHLDLSGCSSLKKLPESMGELKCLVHLDLSGCSSLKEFPESIGKLKCLAHLNVCECELLEQLPESMGKLKCLAHLDLSGCSSLKELPESMGELKCLVHLDLSGCSSLKEFPESMGELKCLAHLDLFGCSSLKELPESMGELKCLAHLNLSGCSSLQQGDYVERTLECIKQLEAQLNQEFRTTLHEYLDGSYGCRLFLPQLVETRRALEHNLHKPTTLEGHIALYRELYRAMMQFETSVKEWCIPVHQNDELALGKWREHCRETFLAARWWTIVTAWQAGRGYFPLGHLPFKTVELQAGEKYSFHGDVPSTSSLERKGESQVNSQSRQISSYERQVPSVGLESRLDLLFQWEVESGNILRNDESNANMALEAIRSADHRVVVIEDMPAIYVDEAKSPLIKEEEVTLDLTRDVLGVSRTGGWVIKTKCQGVDCALKRVTDGGNEPVLARLSHPHIVQLMHYWRKDEYIFLVMELMEGDLTDLLSRHKRANDTLLSVSVAVDIMLQTAKGLLYLHDLGIAYPHLSCSNVLFRESGVLQDGGMQYIIKLGGFRNCTWDDSGGKKQDVYRFGLFCLEVLTGRQHCEDPLDMVADTRPSIPETIPQVLRFCISSCFESNVQLGFAQVVMLLLLAQVQVLKSQENEVFRSFGTCEDLNPVQLNQQYSEIPGASDADLEKYPVHQLYPEPDVAGSDFNPSATLIFFHGFAKSSDEWKSTWMTRNREHVWPKAWLPKDLPGNIRILSLSYDIDAPGESQDIGAIEIGTNALRQLVLSPKWKLADSKAKVILIGHSFGGLVIKSLVVEAHNLAFVPGKEKTEEPLLMKCSSFLENLEGIVFYSVPGSASQDQQFEKYIVKLNQTGVLQRSSLMQALLKDTRLFNQQMISLCSQFEEIIPEKTQILGFIEGKGMRRIREKQVVVSDTSARAQMKKAKFNTVEEDNHFEVCRPVSADHKGYKILVDFLKDKLKIGIRDSAPCAGGFGNYDVFISHRGPDTKTSFRSFLHKDLVTAGLRPFLNCKSIDVGEDSWKCIEHAIKTTPIAVVIFSETFAQSAWCMRELHVMLHTPGVTVLPIFYHVRPSEVRFPESGQLKDGFETLTTRHDKKDIDEWRADLEKASKLMGFEHSGPHKRLERDLVMEVVGKIQDLANKPLPLDVGEHVFGVKQVAEEILQTLDARDDNRKVLVLGLWGMGGIGKSTLARELYNHLCNREFDSTCYVEDVTQKVNQGGVVRVQDIILKDLCKNGSVQIIDQSKGKVILEERLCERRILLVLDDVHYNHEMEYWVSRKMLSKGSMCIVTSRNRRVLENSISFDINPEVYIHDVQALSCVDSERVFASYAFGGLGKVKRGFEELVTNISTACGGVPLVLKVCGALLKGEGDLDVWKDMIKKLNCGSIIDEDKIFKCLRISYDALPEEQRAMFLDVACALLGQSKDSGICLWRSHGWGAALGLRSLVENALITVDEYGDLRMHDHLRDMGRKIVMEERQRTGVCKRLWMPESLSLLKGDEALPHSIEAMVIYDNDRDEDDGLEVTLNVAYMKKLRILICGQSINVTSSLPRSLCWFDWCNHRHADGNVYLTAPQNNDLVVLNMKGSDIQNMPESIGNMSKLEKLDLRSCGELKMLPSSFGRLKKLRSLYLGGSGLQSLPESFGELSNLEELHLDSCGELKMLPRSFGMLKKLRSLYLRRSGIQSLPESFGELSNLEELDLGSCGELKMLPNSFGVLKKLRSLYLAGFGIQSLPESFGELSNLEELHLGSCGELKMLPRSFGRLKKLHSLYLVGSGIQSLPESFGELSNLEELDLGSCGELKMLPRSIGVLKKLRSLYLAGSGLQSLPESFGELSNLEELHLDSCGELKMLPSSFGGLKKLRSLYLGGSGIQSLLESFGKLSNLDELDLGSCGELKMLPRSFGRLKKLRSLYLGGSGIQSLSESFGELSNLEELDLRSCGELKVLPSSFGVLKKLRSLYFAGSGIQILPESFGELSNLEELHLGSCGELKMLPRSFGGLKKLHSLYLGGSGIQSLPESFGELSNLEELDLGSCGELKMLPSFFGGLKKLCSLYLAGSGIQSLLESFGELSNLEELDLGSCGELKMLPRSFGGLKKLCSLYLAGSGIQNLPESFGELSNLKKLDLGSCGELKMLPRSFGRLKKLRSLYLGGSGIHSLLESFGELSNLEELDLGSCGELKMLPRSIGVLKKLRSLYLGGSGIHSLLESFGELSNLEELDLGSCGELKMLPRSFGRLKKLRSLNLGGSGIGNNASDWPDEKANIPKTSFIDAKVHKQGQSSELIHVFRRGKQIKKENSESPRRETMSPETRAGLAGALREIFARHHVCCMEIIVQSLQQMAIKHTVANTDPEATAVAVAAGEALNAPAVELIGAVIEVATRLGGVYILTSLGDPVLDPFRDVVIGLLRKMGPHSGLRETEIMRTFKIATGRDAPSTTYQKVMKELCYARGADWILKLGEG